jgi:acyl-CoA thioester hydrolase
MGALLRLHHEVVQPGWVDYNNHLNDGFYMVIFSHATDALMDHLGLDAAGRARSNCSIFTLEVHVNYLQEVRGGCMVRVDTQILGHDAKRLHIFHTLHRGDEVEPAATNEQMLLHMDMSGPTSAPFGPDLLERIRMIATEHAALSRPANAGRAISLPPKKG